LSQYLQEKYLAIHQALDESPGISPADIVIKEKKKKKSLMNRQVFLLVP
jgi:hypothetical protein